VRTNLPPKWIEYLGSLPESGMGYQRVDVEFEDGRELQDVPVYNGQELDLPDEFSAARVLQIAIHTSK